jgi:hypothetical protein
MDFIEQWFGIAPDGGDGSLEVQYGVAFLALVGSLVFRRRLRRRVAMRPDGSPRS